MSNVVSSKFGQRRLVELPPVNPISIISVPQKEARDEYSNRGPDAEHVQEIYYLQSPRQHLYNSGIAQTKLINNDFYSHGGAHILNTDGEMVTVKDVYRPRADQSVRSMIGQNRHNVQFSQTMPGQDQQVQGAYGSYSPIQQQYSTQAHAQQYYASHPVPRAVGAAQPEQARQTLRNNDYTSIHSFANISQRMPTAIDERRNVYGNNPKEKHIFHGPDGKVIPGPPPGFPMAGSMSGAELYSKDFQLDAVLEFGRLKSITNLKNLVEVPKLPGYLLSCLEEKYGEYKLTNAHIIYKRGQFNVYGVPQLAASGRMERLHPPIEHLTDVHRYGTPPINEMP